MNYCIMLKGRDIINRFLLKNYIEISSMYPVFFTLHFYKQKISRDIHCSLNQSTSCSCYESNINYLSNTTFRGPLWLNRGHLTSPLWKHPFLNPSHAGPVIWRFWRCRSQCGYRHMTVWTWNLITSFKRLIELK